MKQTFGIFRVKILFKRAIKRHLGSNEPERRDER